jgi:hypothetical protein
MENKLSLMLDKITKSSWLKMNLEWTFASKRPSHCNFTLPGRREKKTSFFFFCHFQSKRKIKFYYEITSFSFILQKRLVTIFQSRRRWVTRFCAILLLAENESFVRVSLHNMLIMDSRLFLLSPIYIFFFYTWFVVICLYCTRG